MHPTHTLKNLRKRTRTFGSAPYRASAEDLALSVKRRQNGGGLLSIIGNVIKGITRARDDDDDKDSNRGNGRNGNGNGNNGNGNGNNGNGNGNNGNGNNSSGNGNSGGSNNGGGGNNGSGNGNANPTSTPAPPNSPASNTVPSPSVPPSDIPIASPTESTDSGDATPTSPPTSVSSQTGQSGSNSQPTSAGQVDDQGSPPITSTTLLSPTGAPFGSDPSSLPNGSSGPGGPQNTSITANSATSRSPDVGAIVGGILGAISFILLILFGIYLIRRRQKNRTAPSAEFLSNNIHRPFAGSPQFQRINSRNYETQDAFSATGFPRPPDSPASFLHMREKSGP